MTASVKILPTRLRRTLAVLAATLVLSGTHASAASVTGEDADDAEDATSARISTKVTSDGQVVAHVRVGARASAVREILADAERSHSLAPTTVSAKATRDGTCERVKLQTRGLFSPFVLETRRCPTATGWKETLVSSADFVEYWNEWVVQDLGDATMVTFKTRTLPNVSVPESIILSQTRRVLTRVLRNLLKTLGEPA